MTTLQLISPMRSKPLPMPEVRVEVRIERDPDTQMLADQQLGTLHLEAVPGSVEVRPGQQFMPAWDPQEEALASERFLDMSPLAAQQQAAAQVWAAGQRRAACGVDWTHERLTARAYNAQGEMLSCQSVSGVASDLPAEQRATLLADLQAEAQQEALDWAILRLN
ncbi:hypothetical protein [Deinococcus ruber]|uniref:DUF4376 domain-containing protein n=1 Tax=Deinococcus ruber TaxID=1848197 RepID=A0A918F6I1_9DEIO|nr:hypothetical protein [Deinococcus ruber]GGR13283.1 hypothetical protein GCM10008957_27800 [Deinococcus ruber]